MEILLIVVGLFALVAGGEILVNGSVSFARSLGLPPMVIGLTIVGFGTSTPELLTSVTAALAGSPGVAIGNVIGSNIANILLILGIAALISPIVVNKISFNRDNTALVLATLAAIAILFLGNIGRLVGLLLIAGLALYLWVILRKSGEDTGPVETTTRPIWKSGLFIVSGLAGTIIGAKLLVSGAIEIAARAGLSETVIGLTLVAVGTSLPELVTSVVAAYRKMSDVALGNIVGSNIYNVLGILGITALIAPVPVPAEMVVRDSLVLGAATLLMIVICRTGWKITRLEGGLFLALYAGYVWILWP